MMTLDDNNLFSEFFILTLFSEQSNAEYENESHSVVSNSLWPHGLYSPWNSSGQNTEVDSRSLLQGVFPTRDWTQVSYIAESLPVEAPGKPFLSEVIVLC